MAPRLSSHCVTGYDACNPSVLVGRPASLAELVQQVKAFDRVKAVGVGHRRGVTAHAAHYLLEVPIAVLLVRT